MSTTTPLRLILAINAALACAIPAAADPIDDIVRRQMAISHIPGVAVAVVENGKVVKLQGYGQANLEWNAPADPDTAFQLASATKIFTGVALMRLVERGQISLDDNLIRFFPDAPPAWGGVTVRMLATHTSGLPDDLGSPRPQTVEGVLVAAKARPLAYSPGAEARYGFTDFIILRAILEKVSGQSLPALFDAEIVRPLGLTHTGFDHARNEGQIRSSDIVPHRAAIYAWADERQRVSSFLYGETGYGAGGLYTSARDVALVFAALDSGKLLKPESVRVLQTPPKLTTGQSAGFGIGWTARRYRGVPVSGHSGGPALADILRVDDRKLTIVALTNQQRLYPLLAESIADQYLPAAADPPALPDLQPQLTAKLGAALTGAADRKLDRDLFDDAGRRDAVPFLSDFGLALLEAVGPVRDVRLIGERQADGRTERTYRVRFAARDMRWRLIGGPDGRIAALHPVGED